IVRGRVMISFSDSLYYDPDGYRHIAGRLYSSGTFAIGREFYPFNHPTAYRPPLYPLLLAVFEGLATKHYFIGVVHVLLGVGTVCAVFRLGQLWGLPPGGSLLAAALVTVDPILLNQSVQLMTETLAAFLAAVALVAITRAARNRSIRWGMLAGALFALCILCRPTFLAWLIAAVAVLPFCVESKWRRAVGVVTGLTAVTAAVLAPWAIRNQMVFGRPIITTTHGGYTLLLGNNPQFYEYLRTGAWGSVWDANQFNSQRRLQMNPIAGGISFARRERPDDEVATDARAYELAFENIRNEPLMFAYACLVRVGRLWGVMPHQIDPQESTARRMLRYAVAIWYAAELLLAVAGAWLLKRKLLRSPWIWGVLLMLSFTAVHAFYWTDLRMRAPLMSVVALLAASGMVAIATSRRDATPLLNAT
ncbi:MAG: glycosyltransferase family 39 protein, partial [Planctomycetia bacterium]|nr:glycosyltransferase family 39 protein [Planctomycetia bacterium]